MEITETKGFCAGMALALREEMRLTPRVILLVFLVLQVFDGVLTYTAVAWLGVVGEGNVLLATAIPMAIQAMTLIPEYALPVWTPLDAGR